MSWLMLTSTAEQWFQFVLHQVQYSAVVLVVVWLLCALMGRRWPALQVALWSLVFLRLLLPPGLSHPLSIGALAARGAEPAAVEVFSAEGLPRDEASSAVGDSGSAGLSAPSTGTALLMLLWFAGAIGCAVAFARRANNCRRLLSRSTDVVDPPLLEEVDECRRRLGVRRRVRLLTAADSRVTPFTIGVLRPLIFLPDEVLREPNLARVALAHEMVHVARLDSLWLGAVG